MGKVIKVNELAEEEDKVKWITISINQKLIHIFSNMRVDLFMN